MKIEGLEDQWESYFQDLEVGQPMTKPDLVSGCFQHQSGRHQDRISSIALDELPSLSEVEHEFRATNAYRSTGFDPIPSGLFRACAPGMAKAHFDVVLKQFLWQTEPIQSKGGPLIVIPKRPHASEVSQFRGIMLLPTLAKGVHALLRRRIMSLLGPVKPIGQLGGFARQQVGFGSQPLRVLGRLWDCRGLTSGVLFVDLANAFHRLVRELVTGMVVPQDAAEVVANLHAHGRSTDGTLQVVGTPRTFDQTEGSTPIGENDARHPQPHMVPARSEWWTRSHKTMDASRQPVSRLCFPCPDAGHCHRAE